MQSTFPRNSETLVGTRRDASIEIEGTPACPLGRADRVPIIICTENGSVLILILTVATQISLASL